MEGTRTRYYPKLLPTLLLTAAAHLPAREALGQRYAGFDAAAVSPTPGQMVRALPAETTPVTVDGVTIYYRDGLFFRLAPAGYVVIRAPLGVPVPSLPSAAVPVGRHDGGYWYDRGTFYARAIDRAGFVTVMPPVGSVVPSLPTDVSAIADINGVLYYLYAGVFYRPILQEGRTAYLVADP